MMLALATFLLPALLAPQGVVTTPVHQRFRKMEVMVPMRDGVRLHTAIYVPRAAKTPFPFLIQRTPYGCVPYGPQAFPRMLGPSEALGLEEIAFVYQDVRGRYLSEGTFVDMRPARTTDAGTDESTDTYDTIAWLLKHVQGHNGRAGLWGISYPGHYAAQGMLCGHPALKAVSPQAPMVDGWMGDDAYHHGAFQLAANAAFFAFFRSRGPVPSLAEPRPAPIPSRDGYRWFLEQGNVTTVGEALFSSPEPLWEAILAHPTYDAFWQVRNLAPRVKDVAPAVLTVGGWFDAEDLYGTLALHRALDRQSPGTRRHLVMGPWTHGQWAGPSPTRLGMVAWRQDTTESYQREVEFPFFMHHLRGAPIPSLPTALAFDTGTQVWRRFQAWPPPASTQAVFHFRASSRLSSEPPQGREGWDAFPSDPAKPVPYTEAVSFGYHPPYMTEDQRFAARRPDVLVYETEPLKENLTVAGPMRAVLHVSTTATDADWVVKVVDVHPEHAPTPSFAPAGWSAAGFQRLVRGEVFRGRYRHSFEHPEPFRPGVPEEVAFDLPDVFHTFRKGHRLMIQVQSSWFPLVDRNPQSFVPIAAAHPQDFIKAEHRVYREVSRPSRVELRILR